MTAITFDEELNGVRVRAEIALAQANALRSITRTRLIIEAGDFPEGKDGLPPETTEVDRWMLRRTVFPDVIGAATGGWIEIGEERYTLPDLPFQAFTEIPFMLLVEWEQEAYRLNPHWLPENVPAQKKASGNGSGDSGRSTAEAGKTETTVSPNTSI